MKKVLVIEDDLDILEVVQLILTTGGYESTGVIKGDHVYTKVEEYKPDLIILDILLSGNDGRVICKNLKQNDQTKHIPIIMMSAHPEAKKSTKESGANSFIAKPFSLDQLLNEVSHFIGEP